MVEGLEKFHNHVPRIEIELDYSVTPNAQQKCQDLDLIVTQTALPDGETTGFSAD